MVGLVGQQLLATLGHGQRPVEDVQVVEVEGNISEEGPLTTTNRTYKISV